LLIKEKKFELRFVNNLVMNMKTHQEDRAPITIQSKNLAHCSLSFISFACGAFFHKKKFNSQNSWLCAFDFNVFFSLLIHCY